LINVARSYEEAKRTLDYQDWTNKDGVMTVRQLPVEHDGYYYPTDLELRLTNLTKAGEREAVHALLMELYLINFEDRLLSLAMLQLFMNEIWGTIVKLLPQVSMDHEVALSTMYAAAEESDSFEGLKGNFAAVMNTFRRICDNVNEHKKSQNVNLMEQIVNMLQSAYMQPELCLESVADSFAISKGYLSQFFKEQTGVNFSEFLENLRMAQAKEWLVQTDMPVHEIAARIGYSSSNTFCRAFKRIYGVSTTEFRRSHAS
jgi:two-component system, response regulator YesN